MSRARVPNISLTARKVATPRPDDVAYWGRRHRLGNRDPNSASNLVLCSPSRQGDDDRAARPQQQRLSGRLAWRV
jgi:hypothetical protein